MSTHDLSGEQGLSPVARGASLFYAVCGYAAFVAVFGYTIAFLADVVVPRTVDRGGPETGAARALVIDAALLAGFALQHTVMARPAVKRWSADLVPPRVERATYVLAASLVLAIVCWLWHPVPAVVWNVSAPGGRFLLWTLFALGWAWALAMSFVIDHAGFFGLRQAMTTGPGSAPPRFVTPLPYRLVRHPMMLGFLVSLWAAPTMTAGHLLFATLGSGYILVGVRFEERDLRRVHPEYDDYARRTPRFVPRPSRHPGAQPPALARVPAAGSVVTHSRGKSGQ